MKKFFNKSREKTPLMRGMIVPLLIAAVVQMVVFYGSLTISTAVSELDANSEAVLAESSARRAMYIETEMNHRWSEIESIHTSVQSAYTSVASKYALTVDEFLESDKHTLELLTTVSDSVLASMRINSASGAFFVLANSADSVTGAGQTSYRGVMFGDSDPLSSPSDYSDMVMLKGSSAIAEEYSIPIDMTWTDKFRYIPDKTDMDYFFTPFGAGEKNINADPKDLGYWSKPFYLSEQSAYRNDLVITYSEPVIVDRKVIGTAGIVVSVNEISSLLPSEEVTGSKSGCYALITYIYGDDHATVEAVPETGNGFEQYAGKEIRLTASEDSILRKVSGVRINGSPAYCAYTPLNLYPEGSPYEAEKWAIMAVNSGTDIYADLDAVILRLVLALIVCLAISVVMVYLVTRHVARPVKALVHNVKTYDNVGAIETVDTNISEIHDLSAALNELSSKRSEYQNELITERERYFLVLQSIRDNILEYDCGKDTFFMRYFRKNDNSGELVTREFPEFSKMIEDGKICPKEYVGAMLDFISGHTDENGTYFRIYTPDGDGSTRWTFVRSRSVYDGKGELIRVIASARDVTDERESEQKRLEAERCDSVTKFYNAEYGEILLARYIMEYGDRTAVSALLRIVNLEDMLNRYGHTFCSAVLEEIAIVIRRYVAEDYVVYRGGMDEFVIITPFTSRDDARVFFRNIINDIGAIYNNENLKLECVIGAYIRIMNEPVSSSKYKTRFASEAAFRFRDEFGGIVFADEVSGREDFVNEFKKSGPHKFMPFGRTRLEEVTDIISFAFNVFEKADDIRVAMEVFIKKAGRMLGMDRILFFDFHKEYHSVTLEIQWNAEGMAPIEAKTVITGKAEYEEKEKRLVGVPYGITDTVHFERDADPEKGKVMSEGTSYSVPIMENDNLESVIVYECHEKNENEGLVACLCELTKIVSAYISKSKTTRESRAKSEFLSKMSHEIRTPMNAIIGMTAIAMSDENVSDATMECLKKIDKSSHYLLELINDILDMSRISSGKMTTEETYLNLNELTGQIASMIRVQTDAKGIWLREEYDLSHVHLLGDPLKLNQILVNIMGNAVKFTSGGGILLKVSESLSEKEGEVLVSFSVKDTGIGISEENLDKIFNNFEQADTDTVRKYGGTGLGLSISSNLVKLLGGKLEVKSEIGNGSEFFFTIPMKITEPAADNADDRASDIDFSSKRILIVEDDELNSEIAKTLIEGEGITAEIAENGKLAVEMFTSSEEHYYDAILMDIRMPVMDGIEATKQIRGADRADAYTVPVIAMSANAFDEDMKKSVECGMNGHLTKPIDMAKVMEMFRKIWSAK